MVTNPSLAFAAPHTTFTTVPLPRLTSQIFNLSAFGCFSVFNILAILNSLKLPEFSLTLSTSKPILVS